MNCIKAASMDKIKHSSNLTEAFYNASNDTILCYMDGMPIHKYDVNEYGIVNQGVLDKKNTTMSKELSSRGVISIGSCFALTDNRLIPGLSDKSSLNIYPYNEAVIQTVQHTYCQRPVQDSSYTKMYLTPKGGRELANKLEIPNLAVIAMTTLGFIAKVGGFVTIACTLTSLERSDLLSRIRSYTDQDKRIKFVRTVTAYGVLYSVSEWNTGSICEMIDTEPSYGSDHSFYEELLAINVSTRSN